MKLVFFFHTDSEDADQNRRMHSLPNQSSLDAKS